MSGIEDGNDRIVGATDGTEIGNVGDRLKVDALVSQSSGPIVGRELTSFMPDPSALQDGISEVTIDSSQQMVTRSTVLTDEGSFRDDFTGTSLANNLTGTATFTNGSTTVTGVGTLFLTEVKLRDYVKIASQGETFWTEVHNIISDTELELVSGYLGTTASATANRTNWVTLTPTGSSNAISGGIFTVSSGTTNGILAGLYRRGDYPPYSIQVRLKVSARRTNQETYFGARNDTATPSRMAQFMFDGTNNRVIKCQTRSSTNSYDLEETTYQIPFSTTDIYHIYRIEINAEKVTFTIDGQIAAIHTSHIPGPYDTINMMCLIKNTSTPAGSTDVSIDYMNWSNVDQLEVKNSFTGSPLPAALYGTTASNQLRPVPVTDEGSAHVAIKSPILPFYSIHTESIYPVFQVDAVYGINSSLVNPTTSGSGSATASDSMFVVSTGTTVFSQGVIQSKSRLRYRPGQGVIGRFTAMFTSPVASSYQIAGFGHAEDGLYIGYKDTDFGILYTNRGIRETRTLTITTASTTTQNITVTLNGTAFSVPVTNSGSTAKSAYEISIFSYAGWTAQQVGSTVRFVSDSAASQNGTYSISGTTIVGTFARTKAGQATTETFIKQVDWNGDRLDGSGASGVTIDPTKLNVFEMGIQFLGAGTLTIKAEVAGTNGRAELAIIHEIRLPNTLTASSFGNPSFPFTIAAYSAGSTTNLTVKSASFAGFVEGQRKLQGPRFAVYDTSTTAKQDFYYTLATLANSIYYNGRSNQGVINILSIAAGVRHTDVVSVFLLKNATISAGTPSFSSFASTSMMLIDNGATRCTFSNDQLVWTGNLGVNGTFTFTFSDDITIQPGETLTLAARTLSGTVNNLAINVNIREDQ